MPRARFPAFFEEAAVSLPATDRPPPVVPRGGDEAPAWGDVPIPPVIGDVVTPIEIPNFPGEPTTDGGTSLNLGGDEPSSGGWGGPDTVALYLDWHRYRADWGIYFFERPFTGFAGRMARGLNAASPVVAPAALRQLLFHELAHFEFEVVGTELEDAFGRPLYEDYVQRRLRQPTAWTPPGAALEEALATWREVLFARRKWPAAMPKPVGYQAEAERSASLAPAGYRDWKAAADDQKRRAMTAALVGLIADGRITTYRWGRLEPEERAAVPRYWVGNPAAISAVGARQAGPTRQLPAALVARAQPADRATPLTPDGPPG